MQFLRRIYYLLNRRRLDRELASDMAVHREMLGADNRGAFGNPTLLAEQSREAWGWGWLERLLQDVRFGARTFRRSPGLLLTAVAVLAFGIGVNVTAFNLVDIMFFRPLPVRDPHSLVRFTTQFQNGSSSNVAYPAAVFYRDHSNTLISMIAQMRTQMTLSERETSSIHTGLVTSNYFSDLGISAAYGRLFSPPADAAPDAPAVAVLGNGFFQRHFGGNPEIVGQTIRINLRPATVIGVLPASFIGMDPEGAENDDVWLLIDKEAYFVPDTRVLSSFDQMDSGVRMYGRLKPGITLQGGEQALLPLAQELVQQHPDKLQKGEHLRLSAGGYAAEFTSGDAPALGLFAVLVLLILATTCGNLGNLLLGHAVTRQREIAIRLSLGATRGRVLRQLMTESLLLALLGSAAALALSWYASRALVLIVGGPATLDLMPDWRTMLFALGIGVFACVMFGLPPALQLARQRQRAHRMRTFFMATQVTASCVLLVLSVLLVHGLERALNSDPGFDYQRVVVLDPQLYSHSYSASAALQYMHDLQERLQQIPGVETSAVAELQPLGNDIRIQRTTAVSDGSKFDVYLNNVGPQFFAAMSIPLRRGRTFKPGEQDVAIVSESTARRLWPGQDALQQTYSFNRRKLPVIGVVGNAHIMAIHDGDAGEAYLPSGETRLTQSVLLIKTARSPEEPLPLTVKTARSLDPQLSPAVHTLKQSYDEKLGDSARFTSVIAAMGALALLLAVIGLYGVVSYNVAQRTKEIGIRIALGATPAKVIHSMVSRYVLPLVSALAAGLVLAGALSFVLRSYLYGVHHLDPPSYLGAAALLAAIGGLAALVPARRALKVDPMVALRCE